MKTMTKIKEDDFDQEKTIIPEDETFTANHLTPEEEKAEIAEMLTFDAILPDSPIDRVPEPTPAPEPTPDPPVEEEKKVEEVKPPVEKEDVEEKEEEKPDIAAEMANLASLFSKDDKDLKAKLDIKEGKKEEVDGKEEKVIEPTKVDNVTAFIDSITKGVEYTEIEYLKADDFPANLDKDDILKLNIAINTAVQNAINITRKQSLRDNMDVMPKVFDSRIQTHIVANEFWNSNPHLKKLTQDHPEWATIIRKKADAIQISEPNLTQSQVLFKTGKEIEAFLKKTGSTGYLNTAKVDTKDDVPALPKKPGQVANRIKPNKIEAPTDQDQIMEQIIFNKSYGV